MLARKRQELQSTSPHIDDIISVLKPFGISGYFYGRYYDNGEFIDLTSNPAFADHYFTKFFAGEYAKPDVNDHLFVDGGIRLWSQDEHNVIVQEGKEHFGFGDGINFYERKGDYTEICSFYTHNAKTSMDAYYLNHVDILRKFKRYFVEVAAPIIQQAEENKYSTPEIYLDSETIPNQTSPLSEAVTELVMKHRNLQPLSKREKQCINRMMSGESAKEIANALHISKRTVDHHIANAKLKWNCHKSSELIHIALTLKLL